MSWFSTGQQDADETKAYEWAEYNIPSEFAVLPREAPATPAMPESRDPGEGVGGVVNGVVAAGHGGNANPR
ncbi:MAG TPA: hypothetical protein VLW45_11345 [Pelomicrobium sp.]|nr:hypothetical protein [Pelomicrobium sp.]